MFKSLGKNQSIEMKSAKGNFESQSNNITLPVKTKIRICTNEKIIDFCSFFYYYF